VIDKIKKNTFLGSDIQSSHEPPGFIFCLSAPSGAGKSSLIAALLSRETRLCQALDLKLSVSYTTRAPRPGEQSGREYYFISDTEFDQKIKNQDFLEYATVFKNRYGTSRTWVESTIQTGQSVLLEIDWQGAFRIRELFSKSANVQVVLIYILPPSLETLSSRLQARGKDSQSQQLLRMEQAKQDMRHCLHYDYWIINHDFEQACVELQSILLAHTLTRDFQLRKKNQWIQLLIS
jgi:guanylate kinase